jgi:hypothetical protein
LMGTAPSSSRRERVRSQPDVAEPLGDRVQASRSRLVLPPERNRRERSGVGRRVLLGKLEPTIDPFVDYLPIRWLLPHAGPACRLQREFRVEVRGGTGELDCLLDRGSSFQVSCVVRQRAVRRGEGNG